MKSLLCTALAATAITSAFGQVLTNNGNGLDFSDNFSAYSGSFSGWNSAWQMDRRLPAGVTAGTYQGQSAVDFTVNNSNADVASNNYFFNFQGIVRDVQDGSGNQAYVNAPWQVSASLYISQDMLTGNSEYDSEIWARDNGIDNTLTASYPGIGWVHANAADLASGTGNKTMVGGYSNDSSFTTGLIIDNLSPNDQNYPYLLVPQANVSAGWHNFSILSTGHSFVFSFDGTQVYDESGSAYSGAGLEGLTRVLLENENFNDGGLNYAENPQTDVYWSNVTVTPEPAEFAPFALGIIGLVARRRRRSG